MARPPKITSIIHPLPKGTKAPLNFNGRAPSSLIVPEIGKQLKSDFDLVWDETKKEKQAEADKAYLPAVIPPVSRLSPYNITLPPLPLWEFPTKLKEQPLETQRQFFDRLSEEQVAKIPYQWADYWWDNKKEFSERLPELVVQKRKLTRYKDPDGIYDVYPGETSRKQSPLNKNTDLSALTYQNIISPMYVNPRKIPYYPNRIPESKKNRSNTSDSPEKFYVRDALHGNEVRFHLPPLSFDVSGTFNPKLTDAKVGVKALTGLTGLAGLATLLRSQDSGEPVISADTVSSYDSPAQVLKANQPPLEQQYVTQGLPLSTRPPQSYPVDVADEEPVEVPEGLSSSDLRYLTNGTVQGVSQGVNQQIRDYVRPASTPAPVSTATSTTTTQNPPVVRKQQQSVSTGSTRPRVLNGPRVVSNQSNAPVTGNNLRAETSLARAMVSPPNPDALHRARYQSLMNSGLKGMSPDEAIRSGLLTPEQIQVLMRGPF